MKSFYKTLIKVSDLIFIAEKALLLIAVVVVVSVNFINVLLRYLANSGLNFCETLSICLFMFMVIIGGNIAVKTDSEIKIDIFNFKSERKNAIIKLFPDAVTLAAVVFGLIGIASTISSVYVNKQKVTPLPIYTYHIYMVMFVGFAMILLDRTIVFLRHIMQACGEKAEEEARTI